MYCLLNMAGTTTMFVAAIAVLLVTVRGQAPKKCCTPLQFSVQMTDLSTINSDNFVSESSLCLHLYRLCILCIFFILGNHHPLSSRLLCCTVYIYRALINALSAHMTHINLNMIFYTHVEHSPIKNNLHKLLYANTHTPQ